MRIPVSKSFPRNVFGEHHTAGVRRASVVGRNANDPELVLGEPAVRFSSQEYPDIRQPFLAHGNPSRLGLSVLSLRFETAGFCSIEVEFLLSKHGFTSYFSNLSYAGVVRPLVGRSPTCRQEVVFRSLFSASYGRKLTLFSLRYCSVSTTSKHCSILQPALTSRKEFHGFPFRDDFSTDTPRETTHSPSRLFRKRRKELPLLPLSQCTVFRRGALAIWEEATSTLVV